MNLHQKNFSHCFVAVTYLLLQDCNQARILSTSKKTYMILLFLYIILGYVQVKLTSIILLCITMKYPTNHMHISNNNNFYHWMARSSKSSDNCIWFAGYSVVALLVLCILWIPTKWVMSHVIIMCMHPTIFDLTHKPYSSNSHLIGIDIFWFCFY